LSGSDQPKEKDMRLSDKLKAKRAALLEKMEALLKAVQGSEAAEFTAEQAKEFDELEPEIKRLDGEVERAERAERMTASASSAPASQPTGEKDKVPARPKEKIKADKKVALLMSAQLKGKLGGQHPLAVLEDNGYSEYVAELCETNGITKSVNTLTDSAGGLLVPEAARGELIDILYADTTFLQGNPVRVPLIGGKYTQPYGVSGATAGYVGEGAKKPVSDLTFAEMEMTSKKLAAIVLITKESKRWSFINIQNYVERNLRTVLPYTMNTAAYLGTGSGQTPLGILNTVGIGAYGAATYAALPKAPTIAELDKMASLMTQYLVTRLIPRTSAWAWVMSYRTAEFLRNFRIGSNLDLAFPEMQGANPTWKGIRVLIEYAIPENTGGGTDETVLALVNFNDVLFGEEEGLTTSFSDQATVDVSGTLVHLWQQNMFGLLAEMMHGFGVQNVNSIVRLNNVRWGAP